MKKLIVIVTLIVSVLAVGVVLAAPTNFIAHLSGSEEVPAVDTRAQGQVKFQLRGDELHFKLITANIQGVTQAHIHCGAAGVNGPVIVFLYGLNPDGVDNNGVLSDGIITAGDVIPLPPGQNAACPQGIADFDELIANMRSGNTYVNAHTLANRPGEIRGQVRAIGR